MGQAFTFIFTQKEKENVYDLQLQCIRLRSTHFIAIFASALLNEKLIKKCNLTMIV